MNRRLVERTQTGVRLEKSPLKLLTWLAEYCEISRGNLIEGIALHAFEGKAPFPPETQAAIENPRTVHPCALDAKDSHRMQEAGQ